MGLYRNRPVLSYAQISSFGTNSVLLPGKAPSPLRSAIAWFELSGQGFCKVYLAEFWFYHLNIPQKIYFL